MYEVREIVGKGAFAKVYSATCMISSCNTDVLDFDYLDADDEVESSKLVALKVKLVQEMAILLKYCTDDEHKSSKLVAHKVKLVLETGQYCYNYSTVEDQSLYFYAHEIEDWVHIVNVFSIILSFCLPL